MTDQAHFDVVIVGGAVMGSAAAYFLTGETGFAGSVGVIERDLSYAECTTARSVGGIRQQFSTPENIRMSQYGLSFIRGLEERFGPGADIGFREQGYLLLASEAGLPTLEANIALQHEHGADVVLLDPPALKARFPWLVTDGVAAGGFGQSGEGWVDPFGLMRLMSAAARAQGATLIKGEVAGIEATNGRIAAVTLADGRRISCDALVNAAGPEGGRVAALAGVALPVERRKRYVFVFDCRDAPQGCPLTIDPTGLYVRPEGAQFITGLSPDDGSEPATDDLEVDYSWFENEIWERLAARVPAFEAIKLTGGWAGFYDYNTLDQNAVIGAHPEIENLYFLNGFSGHGLQQAPAAGRAIAELIAHGRFVTIDLTRLGYDRIARREPLYEVNVI